MKPITIISAILLILLLPGCISEYNPPGIEEVDNILVVEGTITGSMTTIKLSRSVKLTSTESFPAVNNALVWVETENGKKFDTQTARDGVYNIPTGRLDYSTRYRLGIIADGEEYRSEYTAPLETPPIDTMVRYKKAPRQPVEFLISTAGNKEQSRYYRWSFTENWEIHARLMADAYQLDPPYGEIFLPETTYYSPFYYCWKQNSSNSLLIGSADKLSENRIDRLKLFDIAAEDDRLMSLYHINITQYSISKEAHTYYSSLKTNVESTGSIFGAIPSAIRGNLVCVTDSSIPVIGYVETASTQQKGIFMPQDGDLYERPSVSCKMYDYVPGEEDGEDPTFFTIFTYDEGPPISAIYTRRTCVDCRRNGGSKIKPAFWPNDHQ